VATFTSDRVEQTEAIARGFAANLEAGAVVALSGELGAGKTHFTKAMVHALGSDVDVTSPTFTLVHEYSGGRLPVYHFDFFRLENPQSAARLGLDEYFFGDGVSVVDWPSRFPELIPPGAHWVRIEMLSATKRLIHLP
jgi:tRNA threonylcarbamoyladenosine biosynthesis protein TsaE